VIGLRIPYLSLRSASGFDPPAGYVATAIAKATPASATS